MIMIEAHFTEMPAFDHIILYSIYFCRRNCTCSFDLLSPCFVFANML